MLIDIIGYVTKLHGNNGFEIKVTSDSVERLSLSNLQVSKEVRIWIYAYHYPSEDGSEFKLTTVEDKHERDQINKFRSLSNTLRMGDQVKCFVCIVEQEVRNGAKTYVINYRRKDIETYADFDLWLCPYDDFFERLEVDSRESLKFRKQWRYTCINREKCAEITGSTWNDYRKKWWINKNPTIILPIIWWIQVKTTVSNLWKRFAELVKDKTYHNQYYCRRNRYCCWYNRYYCRYIVWITAIQAQNYLLYKSTGE